MKRCVSLEFLRMILILMYFKCSFFGGTLVFIIRSLCTEDPFVLLFCFPASGNRHGTEL